MGSRSCIETLCVAISPFPPQALSRRAQALTDLGRLAEALEDLDYALTLEGATEHQDLLLQVSSGTISSWHCGDQGISSKYIVCLTTASASQGRSTDPTE